MIWLGYATWVAAIFFAASWTFGLVMSPRNRAGPNILTVMLWWVGVALAAAGQFSVLHLLWAFPVALVVPAVLLAGRI